LGLGVRCPTLLEMRIVVDRAATTNNEFWFFFGPRSRAVSTEQTILSPFTKEYRVLAAYCSIRLFLKGFLLSGEAPIESLTT
jgi:hypothetical protein